jgi:NADH dehydrogenase FAD-containing subunit
MPGMQRDMSESTARANGQNDRADSPNGVYPTETLDAVIVGAGFAGVYILVSLSSVCNRTLRS